MSDAVKKIADHVRAYSRDWVRSLATALIQLSDEHDAAEGKIKALEGRVSALEKKAK